jgi:putative ATP-binding cassette transporter
MEGPRAAAAIVLLNLGTVYLLVLFNDWYRVFYDALQKNQAVFWTSWAASPTWPSR